MRYVVEPWAVEYGSSVGEDALVESASEVDVGVEVPADQWTPLRPPGDLALPDELAFVDGVRRIEARVWVSSADGQPRQGICASYGAGVVRCNGAATIVEAEVDRRIFSAGPDLEPIVTRHGRFGVSQVADDTADALSLALQDEMAALEHHVSTLVPDDCLLVVDGPLRERRRISNAVGYIKSQHRSYLPDEQVPTVAALDVGERTPVFLIGGPFRRWSWYVRLPGERSHSHADIVRCEVDPDLPIARAVEMADQTTAMLPRFASVAYKDSRAPQNLYPIAGLERELRRRLGDKALLYRALRVAAA